MRLVTFAISFSLCFCYMYNFRTYCGRQFRSCALCSQVLSSIALTAYRHQNIRVRQQRTVKGYTLIISAQIPKLVDPTCVNGSSLFLHKIRKTIKIERKTTRPSDFHFIFKTKIQKFQLLLQPSYKITNSLTWKLEKDNTSCFVNKQELKYTPMTVGEALFRIWGENIHYLFLSVSSLFSAQRI